MVEPENVEQTVYSGNMKVLQVDIGKRIITKYKFHCLQFFEIASDKRSLHDKR